jgi:hypothetical protein
MTDSDFEDEAFNVFNKMPNNVKDKFQRLIGVDKRSGV